MVLRRNMGRFLDTSNGNGTVSDGQNNPPRGQNFYARPAFWGVRNKNKGWVVLCNIMDPLMYMEIGVQKQK